MRSLAVILFAAMLTADAHAQQPDTAQAPGRRPRGGLDVEVARDMAALYNQPAAMRVSGQLDIAASQIVNGNVAALRGPVTIAGRVTGYVVVINGDLMLAPDARIDGGVYVVGGYVEGRERATIGGDVHHYRDPLRFREEDERIIAESDQTAFDEDESWVSRWRRRRRDSDSKLALMTGGSYNRVEGLAVHAGPTIRRTTSWGEVRANAFGILRSVDHWEWTARNVGHDVTAQVAFGRGNQIALGGRAFDVVAPVETWQLRDGEVGLASFFLHRDYRDYWARHGGSAFVRLRIGQALSVSPSYSEERWSALPERDPFTLFRGGQQWRPNPVTDIGRFRLTSAALTYDTRTDVDDPWSGWYVVADVERGSSAAVQLAPMPAEVRAPATEPVAVEYTRVFLDARRYNRVSPDGQLNLRLVMGGWVGGDELPLQRRFALGGAGSLPGYDFRRPPDKDVLLCGGTELPGRPGLCERIAVAQIEYRGALAFRFTSEGGFDEEEDERDWRLQYSRKGEWVVFVDAGRGWLVGPRSGTVQYGKSTLPPLSTFRTDVGAGLDFELIGFFVAKSVSDAKIPPNFFVRLRHRF
ncbi:MAG: BamA/TamA family outer membrane protein [Gemmatimonadaceae bacterium]